MMNFTNLFTSIEEVKDTAIAFNNGCPVYYEENGEQSSHVFIYEGFEEYAEQKIMSRNNGIMCFISGRTLYVLPCGLGNATELLEDAGYTWGKNSIGNNYYVPLSNAESFNPFEQCEMLSKWKILKAVADANNNKY